MALFIAGLLRHLTENQAAGENCGENNPGGGGHSIRFKIGMLI